MSLIISAALLRVMVSRGGGSVSPRATLRLLIATIAAASASASARRSAHAEMHRSVVRGGGVPLLTWVTDPEPHY